jgi:uncharacterized protein YqgC (DUF456 family)
MQELAWFLVIMLFIVGMAGAVYPILPSVVAIYAAFIVYGFLVTFDPFTPIFWTWQTVILILIFVADYLVSALGIQKYGGSKAAMWGSMVGVLIGPFIIPVAGLFIGPFIGALLGELWNKSTLAQSVRIGGISVISLFSSMMAKLILQGIMISIFLFYVF